MFSAARRAFYQGFVRFANVSRLAIALPGVNS
jgi:hypothetical protein